MKKDFGIKVICTLLAFLFAYIAITKLLNYNAFRHTLSVSPVVGSKPVGIINIYKPKAYTAIISITLLIAMSWTVIFLLASKTRLLGLYGSALILFIITMYLAYVICFVTIDDYPFCGVTRPILGIFSMTWKQFLTFNISFLILSIAGILLQTKNKRISQKRELPNVALT